jgi:hypothetical protein
LKWVVVRAWKLVKEGVRMSRVVIAELLVDPYSRWRTLRGQLLIMLKTT